MRTKLTGVIAAIGVLSAVLLSGCGGGNAADVLTNEKLFKSYSTSTYFRYDASGNQSLKVTGKPFIAMRYLRIDPKQATDCFFGLYDVTQQELIAGTAHETEIAAGDVAFNSNFAFPPSTRIVRQYSFGSKSKFDDSNPSITVRQNDTDWIFTLNDSSVKNTTRITGKAVKIDNSGVDSAGNIFKAMDVTPSQP
jgi:hypothetical protein